MCKMQIIWAVSMGWQIAWWSTLAVACECFYQDPPPPPPSQRDRPLGPPGREAPDQSFWAVMRDVHKQAFTSRLDFMALLSHPAIRAEVGIDDEEFEKLRRLEMSFFDEIRSIYQDQRDQPIPHDMLVPKIVDVVHSHDAEFMEHFRAAIDFERFIGILVQVRGNRSVVHEEVAKRIDLPPDKLDEIREVAFRTWREQADRFGDNFRELLRVRDGDRRSDRVRREGSRREGDRRDERRIDAERQKDGEIRKLVERVEKKVNDAVALKLTTEQLQSLNNLRGEPLELSDDFFAIRLPNFPGRRGPPPLGSPPPGPPREPPR